MRLLPFSSRDRALLVGVGYDQAGIHRKSFAADQSGRNASFKDALEHATKHVALAELLMTGTRERRVIWDLVLDREPAKPAVGEVYPYLDTAPVPSGSRTRRR